MMCRLLSVSRSGFYAWLKRPESLRHQKRRRVTTAIEAVFFGFKKRYGAPRITMELNAQGIQCCANHVAKILQEKGLRARNGKRFRYRARIESKTNISSNLLARHFDAKQPNRKWVSDITYIKVRRKWLYLAVVLDLFSRKVIGWALNDHMREGLILEAFNMAISGRDIHETVLLHSDRGVQYRGHEYQNSLKTNGVQCSMSRKGNCWDNAVAESFFKSLKVEWIYKQEYDLKQQAELFVFTWVETWYNKRRRHSYLGYKTINEFNLEMYKKI